MRRELKAGDEYEDFTILEVLGAGSFACVYKVVAQGYPAPLALKLSRSKVESEETAQRALREIAVLRSLTNPHVVRIHDSGLGYDERWFLLMDFLEGQQLSDYHDFDDTMAPAKAVTLIHQACLGLAEAHAAGIVHRDIKPANLWVLPDGTLKVLDFGLARAWDTDNTIGMNATIGRVLIGTVHYTQPEQLETGKLSPASDVYSLGIVLYELISGHCPFFEDMPFSEVRETYRRKPAKWLDAHVHRPMVPFTRYEHTRDLPVSLTSIIEATLEKDPERRPADAGVLANRLGAVLHHDLGVALGATLKVTEPSGGQHSQVLLPGSHRIGCGERCEVRLDSDDVRRIHAIIEWDGAPKQAELRPLSNDGSVRVNDKPIESRVPLQAGDVLAVGPFRIDLAYPSTSPS